MKRLIFRAGAQHGVTVGLIFIVIVASSFMFLIRNWDDLEYTILRPILVVVCIVSAVGVVICACMGVYNY